MDYQLQILKRTLLFVAVTVPAITAVGYFFGPKPYLKNSHLLIPPNKGLVDQRDTLILFGWYLLAIISSLAIYWLIFQRNSSEVVLVSRFKWLNRVLTVAFILVFICNLFIDLDKQDTGNVPALTLKEALVSILFWTMAGFLWLKSGRYVFFFRTIIACGLLIRPLSVLLQTPSSLRDPWHFFFTANELAAPAAGMIPLANFVPWYTSLLGYPIAPILRLIPSESVVILLFWLLFLEAICLMLPVIIAYKIVGHHAALLSILLMVSLITVQPSANSYFQVFPIRTIFPCLLLGLVVFSVQEIQTLRFRRLMFLGILLGLTLLNNLESGLPCLFALVFTTLLLHRNIKIFAQSFLLIIFGVCLVFGLFSLLILSAGRTLNFSYLTMGLEIVVSGGFFQASMALGGYHNIYMIFFVSGMATSVFVFFRAQKNQNSNLKRIAALMSFSSSWGMSGMIYFSGRSYTSTLTVSSNYALGLLGVSIIIWIFSDKEFALTILNQRTQNLFILPVLVFLMFFFIATISLTRMDYVHVLRQAGTGWDEELHQSASLRSAIEQINQLKNRESKLDSKVVQILPLSNILELTTGIEAELVISDPRYLSMFGGFQKVQCQYILDSGFDLVIEQSVLGNNFGIFTDKNPNGSLMNLSFCSKILNLSEVPNPDFDAETRLLRVNVQDG